jgi:hypothetical protein
VSTALSGPVRPTGGKHRAQMLTLPAVDPPTWWRFSIRVGRDHHVRVDTCDYSVYPAAIGHRVTVLTDSEQVVVLASGGEIVAQQARCCARHQTLNDPEHAGRAGDASGSAPGWAWVP